MRAEIPTIAVTGPNGLVGRALCDTLEGGPVPVRVLRVSRSPAPDTVVWSPARGELDPAALEGVDAVVHLAGEPIGPARWSEERKQRIRDSRVKSTRLLVDVFSRLARPPRAFVQASAVGYYGDTADDWVDERDPRGPGFLADVCEAWEGASAPAEAAGIRVVRLRFGHVLGDGGLLETLRTPTTLGLSGRLGSGRQFWSWIGIVDLVTLIIECLADPAVRGVINAVTPHPVRNAEFIERYAAALRRPAWLPVPAPMLRLAFGREQAQQMLLWGQRVRPSILLERGFEYAWPRLDDAFSAIVGGSVSLPYSRVRALEGIGSSPSR